MRKLQTKDNRKANTGITLITLVITIAVLAILAGVSLNAILGDDGILDIAQQRSDETQEKTAKSEMQQLVLEYQLSRSEETLEEFLKEKIPDRIDKVTNNGDNTLTMEKDGYTLTVDNTTKKDDDVNPKPTLTIGTAKVVANSDGTGDSLGEASTYLGNTLYIIFSHSITEGTTTVEPSIPYAVTANGTYKFKITGSVNGTTYTKEVSVEVNQFKNSILEDINIKIGDSVNYTYDTASSSYTLESKYSGYSSNQTIAQTTGLTWKVLNVDKENDTVDIISTNPTSSTVNFYNILGYNNGPYFMNEICKAQYSNKTLGVEARSINLLDMEKHLTPTGITNRNAYTDAVKYGTTKTYTSNTKYPSLYANQKGAGPNITAADASAKITQPKTDAGNDPYEESKPIATTEPTTDNTSGTGSPLTVTQTYYYIPINDTNYGTASSILANSTPFWVAARYVTTFSSYADFGLRLAGTYTDGYAMFCSDGDTYGDNYALRPVVSLSSSLLTGEQTNGAWNLSK